MVKISDCCKCCDNKAEKEEIKRRALGSVQMVYSTEGKAYYPDGAGTVTVPLPTPEDLIQLRADKESIAGLGEDIERLDGVDAGLRADLDALKSKEAADVAELKTADAGLSERVSDTADQIAATASDLQATEAAVAANQSKIADIGAESAAIAKSLVSDVIMSDGTTAGSVQVSIEREDGALITSKNYAWGKSVGCRLEAGTQEGYIKTLIDLSDGTVIESNEYKIVEVLESDVYVTAITLVPNPTAGTIGGTISYSNGTTQSINAVNVPTAPGVTSAIEALQARMTSAEQKDTAQDASLQSLNTRVKAIEDTPGVGAFGAGKLGTIAGSAVDGRVKAEDDGTGSVNGWAAVKTDISQLKTSDAEHTETLATQAGQISAQATEISEVKSTQAQHTNQIRDCYAEFDVVDGALEMTKVGGQSESHDLGCVLKQQGSENAGKILVVGEDGNIFLRTPSTTSSPFYTLDRTITSSPYGGGYSRFNGVVTRPIFSGSEILYSQFAYVSDLSSSGNHLLVISDLSQDDFKIILESFSFDRLADGNYSAILQAAGLSSDMLSTSFVAPTTIKFSVANHNITPNASMLQIYLSEKKTYSKIIVYCSSLSYQ